jgi:hypothetical protein
LLIAFLLPLVCVQPAPGQESADTTKPAKPEPPKEARQFDFWLGEWDVVDPSGKHVGTNVITSILDGFGVMEQWTGDGGMVGMSLNSYDRIRKRWHQTWADNTGGFLRLEGEFTNGSMVLSGVRKTGKGSDIIDRITWTPLESGNVRQVWEVSPDGGESWSLFFDGTYIKR